MQRLPTELIIRVGTFIITVIILADIILVDSVLSMTSLPLSFMAKVAALSHLEEVVMLMSLNKEFYVEMPLRIKELNLITDQGNGCTEALPMRAMINDDLVPHSYLYKFVKVERLTVNIDTNIGQNENWYEDYSAGFGDAVMAMAFGDLIRSGSFRNLRCMRVYFDRRWPGDMEFELYEESMRDGDEGALTDLRTRSYDSNEHTLTLHLLRAMRDGALPLLRHLEIELYGVRVPDNLPGLDLELMVYFSSQAGWGQDREPTWWEQSLRTALALND